MVGLLPVKTASLHDQDFFLAKQFTSKLLVVLDWINSRVKTRKHIKSRFWFDDRHAGDFRQQVVSAVTLSAQPTAGCDKIVDALIAAESSLDRELSRSIRAEPHRRKHVQPFDIITRLALVARNDHPSSPVAARAIIFAQTVKCHKQNIVGQ
ncbi:MAG: hypothetical protein WBD27_10375 [Pyrinomonadaceae bacterium]